MREALAGFALGAAIGFTIGVVLHHSRLLRRGFLPYVVASQTVPILAIAPMVVIWLGGQGLPIWMPVAVIAAYLTFFPVAINTIRGLDSAEPRALELMRSYAASPWKILWKVKFPASLPYNFNQYYSLDPTALWATNIVAAGLGIVFFGAVVIAERLVVRTAPENVA
jgi:NitT/TauT family transport system permease protein